MCKLLQIGAAIVLFSSTDLRAGLPDETTAGGNDTQQSTSKDIDLILRLTTTASNPNAPLLARALAIDSIGRLVTKDPKTVAQQKKSLQGFVDQAHLKQLEKDDEAIFLTIHVVQALGRLGSAAQDALPEIAQAKGYDATLNSAVDAAVDAIISPPSPRAPSNPTKTTKSAAELLQDMGKKDDVGARLLAAKLLSQYPNDAGVLPALLAAVSDSDADVAHVAGESAKRVQNVLLSSKQQYVNTLIAILKDKSSDISMRLMASKALGVLGKDATPALDALKEVVNDPNVDADLKTVAANSVKRIQP